MGLRLHESLAGIFSQETEGWECFNEVHDLRHRFHLGEVGQCTAVKAKGDALPLHVLLPHACNHLQDGNFF